MNIEKLLLLADSGEISGHQRRRLQAALSKHPEWRERERELHQLKTAWTSFGEAGNPSDEVVQRIRQEAERLCATDPQKKSPDHCRTPPRVSGLIPFWPYRPALAAAAGIILAATLLAMTIVFSHRTGTSSGGDDLDQRIADTIGEIDRSLLTLLDSLTDTDIPPDMKHDVLAMKLMLMEDS